MAVSQLPQAPYRQDRRVYPTPDSGDILFSEVRDCTRSEIPEYGTPHPNPKKWPDHKLVFVKPVDIERDGIFEFFYAADRENQDLYNFSVGSRNIIGNAGGREFRVVQRSYVTPRADFQPLDIPFGTPMPNVPEGKFDDIEYVFFDRQQQPIDQQELNSLYVAEVHTYVEKAFLDDKLSYTAQRTDPLPEKFQILVPEQVVEQIVEGKAEMPTLTGSELSVKEDQLNPDVKLVRTASRDRSSLPISLGQKVTTNEKQLASVTQTVQTGDTIEEPSATVDIQSEALGDGTYVVTKTEVPELFTSESYSSQRPDPTPEKFRVVVPTQSTEENIEGEAEMPTLESGELEATEQQINEFVKRKRVTKRDVTSLPKTLTEKITTNEKQIATVKETLQEGDTKEVPSATKDVQSQALGDGTYVVRTVEVPNLFDNKSVSVEKPEVLPERFRAERRTITESINKKVATEQELDDFLDQNTINLEDKELVKRRQKINNFAYVEQTTKIEDSEDTKDTLEGRQAYVNGTIGIIEEKILSEGENLEPDTGFDIEQSKVTPLGGGKFLKETVKVEEYPTLYFGEVDPIIQEFAVTKQKYITAEEAEEEIGSYLFPTADPVVKVQAINKDRSLKLEEYPPPKINEFITSTKTSISLSLPPVLKSINVLWDIDTADGFYEESSESENLSVEDGSLSVSSSGNVSGSASATPILDIELESTWSTDITATNYFFFTKDIEDLTESLNKTFRAAGNIGDFKDWPYFKARTFTVTAIGKSVTATTRRSKSQSVSKSVDREAQAISSGSGNTASIDTRIDINKIGPCLCAGIEISGETEKEVKASVGGSVSYSYGSTAKVTPTSFPATVPNDIPRTGYYVISARAEPYKWGYYRVVATTIDASQIG